MIQLRPYQKAAARAFVDSPCQRAVVVLPTGTGKTVMGLTVAKYYAERLGQRVLWLAHRDELITQPYLTCRAIWPGADRGIVKADRDQPAKGVVFASIQTACVPKRLERLSGFGLVVADECHHAVSVSWRRVLEHLGCMQPGGPRLMGLTATPERADNAALDAVFQEISYAYHLQQAVADGYLVPVRYEQRPLAVDLDKIRKKGGDFAPAALEKAMLGEEISVAICDAVAEFPERKSIVFCVSVRQAHEVSRGLQARGIQAAAVSGETPSHERRGAIKRLRSGDIRCVANAMVFTEGFDEPSIDMIVMARPTQSKPLYIQAVGRGLRLAPGKEDCLVVDMVGATQRHTLVQAPALFGDVVDASGRRRAAPEPDEDVSLQAQLAALQRQIEGVGGGSVARSALRWVHCGEGKLAIGAGDGSTVIAVATGDDTWRVDAARGDELTRLADSVSLELAQGVAEDYVRRCDRQGVSSRDAAWRKKPATAGQRKFLKLNGEQITRGEASDMIVRQIASSPWLEAPTEKQEAALRRMGAWRDGLTRGQARSLIHQGRRR